VERHQGLEVERVEVLAEQLVAVLGTLSRHRARAPLGGGTGG
jgi:hypothetical protein